MFKGPIVYRLDCAGLDCAGSDSVGPDCAGPDRTCTMKITTGILVAFAAVGKSAKQLTKSASRRLRSIPGDCQAERFQIVVQGLVSMQRQSTNPHCQLSPGVQTAEKTARGVATLPIRRISPRRTFFLCRRVKFKLANLSLSQDIIKRAVAVSSGRSLETSLTKTFGSRWTVLK